MFQEQRQATGFMSVLVAHTGEEMWAVQTAPPAMPVSPKASPLPSDVRDRLCSSRL